MWVLGIKPTLPEREKKVLYAAELPGLLLLILMFWHLQLTFRSSFWGERRQQEGTRLEQGREQQMGSLLWRAEREVCPGPADIRLRL